jgi:glycosyltransferase involved in cell wall biosynthesis
MDNNLITVIMPVYNEIRFLPSSVNSILNQTENRFVLLIIDDGSTDGSSKYLKEIISDKVKVYSPGRQGLIKTLNFGLSLVETPYVAIMDADDISHPLRLERELGLLQSNSDISLVGTSAEYIGDNDEGRSIRVKMPTEDYEIKNGLKKGQFVIIHSTIMARRSLFEKLNGYSEKSFPNPDYDLFLRTASFSKFANITELYCKVRFHKESHTFRMFSQIIKNLSESIKHNDDKLKQNIITNFFRNFKIQIKKLSIGIYRKGILNYVNDKVIVGVLLILLSGIINPLRGVNFLRNKFSLSDSSI